MYNFLNGCKHGRRLIYSVCVPKEGSEILSWSPRKSLVSQRCCRYLSSKKSDDDANEADPKKSAGSKSERSTKAKARLDSLLQSIVKENKDAAGKKSEDKVDLKLAVPIKEKKQLKDNQEEKTLEEKEAEHDLGKEIVTAVKQVAESVEGDPKVIESELVQKLKTQVGKKVNLSDLFAGMKIDRSSKAGTTSSAVDMELSRAHRVRRLLDERTQESSRVRDAASRVQQPGKQRRQQPTSSATYVPIDLFGSPPLGIFSVSSSDPKTKSTTETPKLKTWDALYARDLKLAVTHPPANGFEEMILWTEQGKLWKFPINNEQGLDEEAKVPFHEHVFLEPQIESWCPKKGPIRHFMELVCVGLSKNPFLTVKEKHEQIEWYHTYFKEKAAIIKEVGAGEIK